MTIIHNPHDRLFKTLMLQQRTAVEFFQSYLPAEILSEVDLSTLELQSATFIDEELQLTESDMLYAVKFRQSQGYFYLLVEHQSKAERLLPFRVLHYVVKIIARHIKQFPNTKLPCVYPIVFYNGRQPYRYSLDVFDNFADEVQAIAKQALTQPLNLIDLSQLGDDELRQTLFAGTMALTMKHIFEQDFLPVFKQLCQSFCEIEGLGGSIYNDEIMSYILHMTDMDDEELKKTIQTELTDQLGGRAMTVAERLKIKGKEEGRQEGRQEKSIEIAQRLLVAGAEIAFVIKMTQLSEAEVLKLKEQLK